MKAKNNFFRAFCLIFLCGGLLSSCTYRQTVHGAVFYEEYESLQPGKDSKEAVLKKMGEPSLTAAFRPNIWYYISSKRDHSSFRQPTAVEHQVVRLVFNNRDILTEKEIVDALAVAHISPDKDKTAGTGVQRGVLEEIFGNIGQVGN